MPNIHLKKYQTQNFVNQYLQKCGKKYPAKIRKYALQFLKLKGFKEFEKIFIKNWTENIVNIINPVIDNFSKIFLNIGKQLTPLFNFLQPNQYVQNLIPTHSN